jgi:hypothetical protein
MSIPDRSNLPEIKKSEQVILNTTSDADFNVIAIEALAYDSSASVLRRVAVDSSGKVGVAI